MQAPVDFLLIECVLLKHAYRYTYLTGLNIKHIKINGDTISSLQVLCEAIRN